MIEKSEKTILVTTRAARQVRPRGVKAGLGGHDAGASGGKNNIESDEKPETIRTSGMCPLQWF